MLTSHSVSSEGRLASVHPFTKLSRRRYHSRGSRTWSLRQKVSRVKFVLSTLHKKIVHAPSKSRSTLLLLVFRANFRL